MTEQDEFVPRWLGHIRALAVDIGPRGSTTHGELRGAEYCHSALREIGLHPATEPFLSARSIFLPHLIASTAILAAFILYPLGGRWSALVAALLASVAIASELMELSLRDNLLRRVVPKAQSQNVIATIAPSAQHKQDIILMGHVDTQRTPLIFESKRWVAVYRIFATTAIATFLAEAMLYILGAITTAAWIWPVTIPSAICAALLMAMCIQADTTPFTAGANDNASAVGLVLALANRIRATPLLHSRVWFACTGCEEVQHYGAIDFFRRHKKELHHPVAVAFELMGCAGPAWLLQEGIVVPFRATPRLIELAERVSASRPECGAYPTRISGGNTEMADALRVGVPAITLMGITREGEAPHVHTIGDTFDKIDEAVLSKSAAFVWAYLVALDAAAP
ncbi:MAG TPA: M28 family peptidase [Anaerolineales bacterium]|nr:M28 family peptidase [Anaerolineales bacterium]